jgi:hypothetical protein
VACIIPVILSPVDWQSADFGKFQALPAGGKPISEWSNREAAFADVAKGIRAAVEKIKAEIKVSIEASTKAATKPETNVRMLPKMPAPAAREEAKLRSTDGATPARVHFSNMTSAPVPIHWLDYSGNRKLYKTLNPSQSCMLNTYLTHPWLVTGTDGKGIALFMPEPGLGRAVISAD